MYSKQKIWSVLASVVMVVIILSACSTPTPETIVETVEVTKEVEVVKTVEVTKEVPVEVEVTAEPDPVTIKVMNWSQEQVDFYNEAIAEFQKEYPWITVEWETLAQDQYREALPLMFQSGESPDIFFWIGSNRVLTMAELYDLGWIRSIHPNANVPEEWKTRWSESAFLEGVNMINGVVYSFPFNDNKIWGPGYMYMNKAVFEDAGLDPESPPTTWSELQETCRTIKESTGAYCMAIPLKGTDFQRTWYPLAGMAMTDKFFDLKNGRFAIDDPKLLETFSFIQDLYAEDLVVPGVEDKAFARAAVGNGQAAIYLGGAWMPGVFKSMGFEDLDLGVALPPVPDEGRTGALAQSFTENKYFVSSQSQHPEEAWLFLEWMTRPDGFFATEYLARGFGTLAYSDNAEYITDPGMLKVVEIAAQGLRVAYPEPVVACPDVTKSKAYNEAENYRRNWEWEAMVEAITSGSDFAPVAQEIAATKNDIFQEVLTQEATEEGLKVSVEVCYTFPEWEYTENYDPANYADHQP